MGCSSDGSGGGLQAEIQAVNGGRQTSSHPSHVARIKPISRCICWDGMKLRSITTLCRSPSPVLKWTRNKTRRPLPCSVTCQKNCEINSWDMSGGGKLKTSSFETERGGAGLSIVAAGSGVDGSEGRHRERVSTRLIFIVRWSLAISAMLAEFTRNASSNPSHLHDVQFTATWASR